MKPLILIAFTLLASGCACCSPDVVERTQSDSTTVTYNLVDIPIPATDKHFTLFPLPIINAGRPSADSIYTFQDSDTRGTVDLKNRMVSIHTDEKKVTTPVPNITKTTSIKEVVTIEPSFWQKYGAWIYVGIVVTGIIVLLIVFKVRP